MTSTTNIKMEEGALVEYVVDASMEQSTAKDVVEEDVDIDLQYDAGEQQKIIHRLDRRLIVTTGAMYCVSLMDRTNMPNAAIAGMNTELKMDVGYRYSTVALVFFITYTILQPPTTVLIRQIGPRTFLPALCLAWGIVMISFGFPKNWVVMIPLRLLLGAFEAGFFPGSVFLISTWYSRFDMQKRYAFFYLIGSVASASSGILAYGIMQMNGLAGLRGWRWIFIIEGTLTCVVAIVGYIFMVGFPDQELHQNRWNFLSRDEIAFILRRIDRDRRDAVAEKWSLRTWANSAKDMKIWGYALIFCMLTTQAYAIAFFLPIILRNNMGFSVAAAQCLVAPPYIFAGLLMIVMAWIGDKYRTRGPLLVVGAVIGLIGLPLLAFAKAPAARYFGVFLLCGSCNGSIPTCMAWQGNNIRGHWKRAFCSASLVAFAALGGIAGSLIFRSQDSPHYRPGIYASMVCNVVIITIVSINTIAMRRANKKAEKGESVVEGMIGFRYTY